MRFGTSCLNFVSGSSYYGFKRIIFQDLLCHVHHSQLTSRNANTSFKVHYRDLIQAHFIVAVHMILLILMCPISMIIIIVTTFFICVMILQLLLFYALILVHKVSVVVVVQLPNHGKKILVQ